MLNSYVEDKFLGQLFTLFNPPERLSTKEYAETHRWLSSEVSAFPGKMDCSLTPYMLFVMECMDNPDIKVIVARKSAQIAWSETQNSYISKNIDIDPQNIIMAFPRTASGSSYAKEKIRPMIRSNPRLLKKIGDPDKCSFDFYKFPGGFLKLVTAGSVTAIKSTSAPILIVEEPDDLKEDLKGQGDALEIFTERQKAYKERKLIYGGTPSEEGFSKVEAAFKQSNQMFYYVLCPKCDSEHTMVFDNLKYNKYPDGSLHPIFGLYDPNTAFYSCPNCADIWDDNKKNKLVSEAIQYNNLGWKSTAKSEIYGFAFNELLSNFPGSTFKMLAGKKLRAEVEYDKGKDGKLKAFRNNNEGLAYSPKTSNITIEKLKESRLDYEEMVVPVGGTMLTAGIDVQHNRFAVIIRAWGRNGNSWLIYWGELYGYTKDPEDAVWEALTKLCLNKIPHALSSDKLKISLPISGISIDSGDGNTTELVYSWVKQMQKYNKYIIACKGSSDIGTHKKEIFTVPTDPDVITKKAKRKKLAESSGVIVYIIGTQKAKDEVLRKLTLSGSKDRSFHYKECRNDYEEQLLSNKKKISPSGSEVRYELVFGKRDEALDCEVLALHSSRLLHLHLWSDKHWAQAENSLIKKQSLKYSPAQTNPNVTPGINYGNT